MRAYFYLIKKSVCGGGGGAGGGSSGGVGGGVVDGSGCGDVYGTIKLSEDSLGELIPMVGFKD